MRYDHRSGVAPNLIEKGRKGMHWTLLCLAIALEVCGTTCMKLSEGFTRPIPSILMGLFYVGSLGALTLALKQIDISVAYAAWAGLGTALIAAVGIFYFQEPATTGKIVSLLLIITGVVGLNLSGGGH